MVYESSNSEVATVNSTTGEVGILKAGTTTITAKAVATAEYYGTLTSYKLTVESLGAALPFRYNGNGSGLSDYFEFVGTKGIEDYSSDNAHLKFADSGDELTLKLKEAPGTLSYHMAFYKAGRRDFKKIEGLTSVDGVDFVVLKSYGAADYQADKQMDEAHLTLPEDVRFIRWQYTEKGLGNVGIGAIYVTKKGEPTTMPLVVGQDGYATFYSADAFVMPEGLVGNTGNVENNRVVLQPKYNADDFVSAKTPIL